MFGILGSSETLSSYDLSKGAVSRSSSVRLGPHRVVVVVPHSRTEQPERTRRYTGSIPGETIVRYTLPHLLANRRVHGDNNFTFSHFPAVAPVRFALYTQRARRHTRNHLRRAKGGIMVGRGAFDFPTHAEKFTPISAFPSSALFSPVVLRPHTVQNSPY